MCGETVRTVRERRDEICEIVKASGNVNVAQLGEKFGVSLVSIRKDLRALSESGLIKREYGVAKSAEPEYKKISANLQGRLSVQYEEKLALAKRAAEMVHDGDVVLLAPGSTCYLIAKELCARRDIIIVTNAVNFHTVLEEAKSRVVYLGGEYNPLNGSMIGSIAMDSFAALNIDKFFLSANGVSVEKGLTSNDFSDFTMMRAMINRSKEVILVADKTKFEKSFFMRLTAVDEVDTLITENGLDEAIVESIKNKGVTVDLI